MYLVSTKTVERYELKHVELALQLESTMQTKAQTMPSYEWRWNTKTNQWRNVVNHKPDGKNVNEPSIHEIQSLRKQIYRGTFHEQHFFDIPSQLVSMDTIGLYKIETILPFRLQHLFIASTTEPIGWQYSLRYIKGIDDDPDNSSVISLSLLGHFF